MFRPDEDGSSIRMRPIGNKNGRTPEAGYPSVDRELGGFLAGFIEGEACFTISRQTRGYGYRCVMSLNARDDDASLPHELADKARIGRVRSVAGRPTSRPQGSWNAVGLTRGGRDAQMRLLQRRLRDLRTYSPPKGT